TPYITAFTAGHISARSPVLVSVSPDQRWRDSSSIALQELFRFDPKVAGRTYWHDRTTLAFQPDQRLDQGTTYTVTFHLGKVIEVPDGFEEFTFQITTHQQSVDVQVAEMQPLSPNDLTWQRLIVQVYTSDDATGQELEQSFTATQHDRELPLIWEHEPNGRYHRFVVDSVRRDEKASRVDIDWNAERIGSSDRGDIVFDVPSIGDLSLISSSTDGNDDQKAVLLFSDPLDPSQDLTGLVGITGADDVRVAIDGNRLMIYPQQRLSGDQQAFVPASL